MMTTYELLPLEKIFKKVMKGDIHETNKLGEGDTPLIGCGTINQGVEGYFNLSGKKTFKNSVTIAGDGTPLTAFYHNYKFSSKDNVIVCVPKSGYSIPVIYYILSIINSKRWRFSYGRKCYITKMKSIKFPMPVNKKGDIDIGYIEQNVKIQFEKELKTLRRKLKKIFMILPKSLRVFKKTTPINSLFHVSQGGAKKGIKNYSKGKIPYASSGNTNNSIIGMVSPLNSEEITQSPAITVTAFCQARVQLWDFIGRGNGGSAVKILKPKIKMTSGELFWYASQINMHSWKFNYGIMVSQQRLKKMDIMIAPKEYQIDLGILNNFC